MHSSSRKTRNRLMKTAGFVILLLATLCAVFPIIWLVLTSFKSLEQTWAKPPVFVFMPTLNNYADLLSRSPFSVFISNSTIVASLNTLVALVLACPTAYALVRLRVKRANDISFWILSLRMLPPVAALVPLFVLFHWLQILDTLTSLIISYMIFNIPFVVWMMMSFFSEVPKEIAEAAMVDGCSHLTAFLRVVLPLVRTGIFACAIFCVMFSWNEFLFALIFTGAHSRTAPVAIASEMNWQYIGWGQVAAAATLVMLPILVFTLIVQRWLVRGLSLGAMRD